MSTITMQGRVTIGGAILRCPGRGAGDVPRRLTFMASGQGVNATCGERHRGADGGKRAQCFFPVEQLTAAQLATLAKGKPGRVRLTLPGGRQFEGRLTATAASSSSTSKAAAAVAGKGGKAPAPGPAKPVAGGRATGGSFAAAMGAVAAVAGAAGQTAAAAGQVATAGASAVGSVSSVAREGIAAGRDGIKAADGYGKRRHERSMRGGGGEDDGD